MSAKRHNFLPAGPRRVLSVACLLAVAMVSSAPVNAAQRNSHQTKACFIGKRAMMTTADVDRATRRAFTHFLTVRSGELPGAPIRYVKTAADPVVRDFAGSTLLGFLINISLHGKYRRENNALARRLRYRIGKWPLVPFEGPIVHAVGGVLEAYDTQLVWRSSRGASQYMYDARGSLPLASANGNSDITFPVHLGNGAFGYVQRPIHPKGLFKQASDFETQISVHVRTGDKVLWVVFREGPR